MDQSNFKPANPSGYPNSAMGGQPMQWANQQQKQNAENQFAQAKLPPQQQIYQQP